MDKDYTNYDELVGIDTTVPTFGDVVNVADNADDNGVIYYDGTAHLFLTPNPVYTAISINNDNIVFSTRKKEHFVAHKCSFNTASYCKFFRFI